MSTVFQHAGRKVVDTEGLGKSWFVTFYFHL